MRLTIRKITCCHLLSGTRSWKRPRGLPGDPAGRSARAAASGVGARGTAVAAVSTASNASVNLASRVPDQELQPVGMAFELHHQVTNLLGHPLPQGARNRQPRSEEHTSELQSPVHLV